MIKTLVVLALFTVGLALSTLAGQATAVEAFVDVITTWLSALASVVRCSSVAGIGWCA